MSRRQSLNHVKHMANIWSDWVNKGCRGLGYASETTIARLTSSPGRSTRRDYSPDYEPDPIARRFDDALQQIPAKHQNLIYCRFILCMSDARLMEYDNTFHSEGAARWGVESAMREVGKVL